MSRSRPKPCFWRALTFWTFLCLTSADQFTSPSNSVADLTAAYKVGQDVQLAWDTSLDQITLIVAHWGGGDVGALLSDAANPGVFSWTIGQSDNIDEQELENGKNFVLILRDPSGDCPDNSGWVNCQLQSRGFRITSNATNTSTSSSTTSTLPTSSTLSSAVTAASTSSIHSSSHGLGTGAKAGIGVGAAIGAVALIGIGIGVSVCFTKRLRRRKQQYNMPPSSPTTGPDAPQAILGSDHTYHYTYPHEHKPLVAHQQPSELPEKSHVQPIFHELSSGGENNSRR